VTVSRRDLLAGAAALGAGSVYATGALAGERQPLIAAASSLKGLLDELAATVERETGVKLRLVFGGTTNLVRQIEQGAPYELLLAADEASVQRLAVAGLTRRPPVVFALGQLSLIVPYGAELQVGQGMAHVAAQLQTGQIKRFAIANPELAPYGQAAQQALKAAGVWGQVEPKLMLAENVALAASFVAMGGAQAGIVSTSTALLPGLARSIRVMPVAAELHAPIRHTGALLKSAGPEAAAAFAALTSPAQRMRFAAHGFSAP
jgi:molybdate transport system substrate-binding protein